MKTCAVCQNPAEDTHGTCPSCGEASWHTVAAEPTHLTPPPADPPATAGTVADIPAIALGPGDPAVDVQPVAEPEAQLELSPVDAGAPVEPAPVAVDTLDAPPEVTAVVADADGIPQLSEPFADDAATDDTAAVQATIDAAAAPADTAPADPPAAPEASPSVAPPSKGRRR